MTELKEKKSFVSQGYRYIWVSTGKYVGEHRLVMQNYLGRMLEPWEIVHHKDHNRLNNNPENLVVCSQSEHCKLEGFGQRLKGIPKTKEHIANWKRSRWKK